MDQYFKYYAETAKLSLFIRLKPAARQDLIEDFVKIDDKHYLKIKVKEPPVDGKANIALINLLSKNWRIKSCDIEIISGLTSQYKIILIKNTAPEYLKSILSNYINCIDNQIKLDI